MTERLGPKERNLANTPERADRHEGRSRPARKECNVASIPARADRLEWPMEAGSAQKQRAPRLRGKKTRLVLV